VRACVRAWGLQCVAVPILGQAASGSCCSVFYRRLRVACCSCCCVRFEVSHVLRRRPSPRPRTPAPAPRCSVSLLELEKHLIDVVNLSFRQRSGENMQNIEDDDD
jgi:hypothetical protein